MSCIYRRYISAKEVSPPPLKGENPNFLMTSATIATGQGGGRERNKKKGNFFSNFVAIREGVKKDLLNGGRDSLLVRSGWEANSKRPRSFGAFLHP